MVWSIKITQRNFFKHLSRSALNSTFSLLWPWKPWLRLWCTRGIRCRRRARCWCWRCWPSLDGIVSWMWFIVILRCSHVRFHIPHYFSVGFTLHLIFVCPDIIQRHTIPIVYPSECLSVSKKQNFSDTLKSKWWRVLPSAAWRLSQNVQCSHPALQFMGSILRNITGDSNWLISNIGDWI